MKYRILHIDDDPLYHVQVEELLSVNKEVNLTQVTDPKEFLESNFN